MHLFLLVLAVLTLILCIVQGFVVTRGGRKLARLEEIPQVADDEAPRVSFVVPACNEERHIEEAMSSLLSQDYRDFEVIGVDDRSTDATGSILDRMAWVDTRLRVVHVTDLPEGWLGKNHALQFGAAHSAGTVLVFTDADVIMEPTVLRRAVLYFESHSLDHLAIAPRAVVNGFWSNAYMTVFALAFSLYTRPWKVKDPKSRAYAGIGAFNMVKASSYWEAGGHAPIAMRPDDDVKLGKLMKLRGFRSDMLFGARMLSVDWYHSFVELRQGLMKNLFAVADYSVVRTMLACVVQFAVLVWPFLALVCTTGWVRLFNLLTVAAICVLFKLNAGLLRMSPWWCFSIPLGALASIYLILRAMLLTLIRGGIEWRGTRYPLRTLRANRI